MFPLSMAVAALVLVTSTLPVAAQEEPRAETERIEFDVRETAGIRRFSYPVTARLRLPQGWSMDKRYRLRRGEQTVAAQFSPSAGDAGELLVDFHVSCLPHEVLRFQVERDERDRPEPEVRRRITASRGDGGLVVDAAGVLQYGVADDLSGLVHSVRIGEDQWLRDDSPGWLLVSRDGQSVRIGSDGFPIREFRVVRQGSHVCEIGLRAEGVADGWKSVRFQGALIFPLGKSWFELEGSWDDPEDRLAESRWELDLQLSDPPLLVDFSAGELVYLTLRAGEDAQLRTGRSATESLDAWEVRHGPAGNLVPLVSSGTTASDGIWAHLMDRKFCTAIALRASDRMARDRMELLADGRTVVVRHFPAAGSAETPPAPKRMRGWYHFVYFPPHISAATSPQSMLNPLAVEITHHQHPTTND
jgi:hypothetical protein